EERLGEAAFFDFMRLVYQKYRYQVLRVADFQRELELFTGRSWQEFFQNWLYSTGTCDWALDKVEAGPGRGPLAGLWGKKKEDEPTRVRVHLSQRGQCNDPTVLGFRLAG